MSEYNVAADAARQAARQNRALAELGDFLERVGNLETVEAEATRRRDAAQQAEQEAAGQLERTRDELQRTEVRLSDLRAHSEQAARAAEQQAAEAKRDAEADVRGIYAEADKRVAAARTQVKYAQVQIDQIEAQVQAKRQELTDLEAKIDAAKKAALTAFGG